MQHRSVEKGKACDDAANVFGATRRLRPVLRGNQAAEGQSLNGENARGESVVDARVGEENAAEENTASGLATPGETQAGTIRRGAGMHLRAIARAYLVVLLIPILILVFSLLAPSTFATLGTAQTLLTTNAALLILAVGQTFVLAVGEFDLSFAGLVGMSGCLMVAFHVPVGTALIVSLAAVLVTGLANAAFVVLLGVNSLIATLGMSTVTTGIALAATSSQTVPNPYGGFGKFINYRIGGVGVTFYIALAGILILWGVLERTRLGRKAYFVGSGRKAAAYAGIRVNRIRTLAFIISAFTSWLAGLFSFRPERLGRRDVRHRLPADRHRGGLPRVHGDQARPVQRAGKPRGHAGARGRHDRDRSARGADLADRCLQRVDPLRRRRPCQCPRECPGIEGTPLGYRLSTMLPPSGQRPTLIGLTIDGDR